MRPEETYSFNEGDGVLEIKTEIDEDPVDAFPLVLFLLENEHVMVEELLQLLVGQVDTNLLESVELWSRGRGKKIVNSEPLYALTLSRLMTSFNIRSLAFSILALGDVAP